MRTKLILLENILNGQEHSAQQQNSGNKKLREILAEVGNIKQDWFEIAARNLDNENKLKNEVLQTQYALERLEQFIARKMAHDTSPASDKTTAATLPELKELAKTLEDLEFTLENRFLPYLDQQQKIPVIILEDFAKAIQDKLPAIKKIFQTAKVKPGLANAVITPLEVFATADANQFINTGKLSVLRELFEYLAEMIHPGNLAPSPTHQLLNIICYCNLNSHTAIHEVLEILEESVDTEDLPLEKLYKTTSQLNHYTDMNVKTHLSYDNTNRHIKNIITEWLLAQKQVQDQEIKDWEQAEAITYRTKVETSLNVSEIGLIIRLFYFSKILLNKNKKALIRMLARAIQSITKKSMEPISEYNLWNASYKHNYTTLKNVRAYLKEMIAETDNLIAELYKKKP